MSKINVKDLFFIVDKNWEDQRYFIYDMPETAYLNKDEAILNCSENEIVVDWDKLFYVIIENTHDDA